MFTAVEPSTQGATGWVANGQYNLPPDIGDVGLGISAAGSTATASDGTAEQNLVIRLDILDRGNRLFTIDPSGARLTDDTGHVVIGATAYSGNMQVAQITLGPGGRDDVQLAFALPSTMVVATLSAVSVDLPYMYGTRSDIAHFTFAPAQAAATPVGGGGAIYTPNVYNDYYIAPGYAGGYGSSYYPDLMSTWWGSDWGNPELAWADSSWWWTPGFPWWL
ncbi:MAG: hypothetical protein NT049_00400, partial [Planctomycetota bacterium]|nr:hypothetical protein [Planctomycetota bacterium]